MISNVINVCHLIKYTTNNACYKKITVSCMSKVKLAHNVKRTTSLMNTYSALRIAFKLRIAFYAILITIISVCNVKPNTFYYKMNALEITKFWNFKIRCSNIQSTVEVTFLASIWSKIA